MRPDRFQQLLLTAAATVEGATAKTFADADEKRFPYGVTVTVGGKSSRWQIVAVNRPGDRYDQDEPEPVLGEKPAAPEQQSATAGTPAHLEGALATAVLAADDGEIASVDLYSRRPEPPKLGHGFTLFFHDASKIFVNAV